MTFSRAVTLCGGRTIFEGRGETTTHGHAVTYISAANLLAFLMSSCVKSFSKPPVLELDCPSTARLMVYSIALTEW